MTGPAVTDVHSTNAQPTQGRRLDAIHQLTTSALQTDLRLGGEVSNAVYVEMDVDVLARREWE